MAEQTFVGDNPSLGKFLPQLLKTDSYLSSWSSPEAYSRYIKGLDPSKKWNNAGREPDTSGHYGTDTFEEALELGDKGWQEGVEKVYKLRDRINALNPIIKRPQQFGIAGTVPSVPRAVAGNPMNMRLPTDTVSRRKPVITIMSNMSANWGVNADMITNRASIVASLVDRIEAVGFGCEVVTLATSASGYGAKKFQAATMVTVKEAGQPVDVGRLAFGLGHVAMFRRLIFADWCGHPVNKSGLGSGLGSTCRIEMGELNQDNIFVLDEMGREAKLFANDEIAATEGLAFLIDSLKKQGCPAFTREKVHEDELVQEVVEEEPDYEDDWD